MAVNAPATTIRRLTTTEVAARLRVTSETVVRWIRDGSLPGIEITVKAHSKKPRYVVDERDLLEFERRRTTQAKPVKAERRRPVPEPGVIEYYK